MRLASWIRFETFMASDDWEGAISMLVPNLHQPDQELVRLLQLCVAGQKIASPIPFREVFVILALFLPQLTFTEGASMQTSLWASPTVQKQGLRVDITPTAAGLQGMHEYRVAFPSWSQAAVFCPAHLQHYCRGNRIGPRISQPFH